MSLQTDRIFVKALKSDAGLMRMLAAHDVYNTAIPVPDVDLDNVDVPYVIVSFNGMNLTDMTKDDSMDGDTDMVNISIEVAAETRPQLAEILIRCRQTIRDYFEDNGDGEDSDLIPEQMEVSATSVQYDGDKPCFFQSLNYQCETKPD